MTPAQRSVTPAQRSVTPVQPFRLIIKITLQAQAKLGMYKLPSLKYLVPKYQAPSPSQWQMTAMSNADAISLPRRKPNQAALRRQQSSATSSRQHRKRASGGKQAAIKQAAEVRGSFTIGQQPTTLIIKDGHQTVLQRFSPSSAKKVVDFNRRAAIGRELFSALEARRGAYIHHTGQVWHTGLWANEGKVGLTPESIAHPELVAPLVHWMQGLFDRHILTREEELAEDFKLALSERQAGFEDMKEILGERLTKGFQHWWTMAAFFSGETGGAHVDRRDTAPSLLVNFGAAVELELPNRGLKVRLNRGDVAIFNSKTEEHRTRQLEEGDRWGVGLFLRQVVVNGHLAKKAVWRKGVRTERIEGRWEVGQREAARVRRTKNPLSM